MSVWFILCVCVVEKETHSLCLNELWFTQITVCLCVCLVSFTLCPSECVCVSVSCCDYGGCFQLSKHPLTYTITTQSRSPFFKKGTFKMI